MGADHSANGARQYPPGHGTEGLAQEEPLRKPEPASERDTTNHSNRRRRRSPECKAGHRCADAHDHNHNARDRRTQLEQYDLPVTPWPRVTSSLMFQA